MKYEIVSSNKMMPGSIANPNFITINGICFDNGCYSVNACVDVNFGCGCGTDTGCGMISFSWQCVPPTDRCYGGGVHCPIDVPMSSGL